MKPSREPARKSGSTYFVTSATAERKPLFRYERWCLLFLETLAQYRGEHFALHDFVLMPDHFHLLLSPSKTLEKAMQRIKGGFSRRASVQFGLKETIWQRGFTDHRIRDAADYERHQHSIWLNPVKAGFCRVASDYAFGSASPLFELDSIPQRLKPLFTESIGGTAEAAPFQNNDLGWTRDDHRSDALAEQIKNIGTAEAVTSQSISRTFNRGFAQRKD